MDQIRKVSATPVPVRIILSLLRILIGWHFLYEGLVKLLDPNWTSASYLTGAHWLLADFFKGVAGNPGVLHAVDMLNIWGLMLIGAGLMFGFLTRVASIAGALILLLYYVVNPPLPATGFGLSGEGNYLIINKNLIEMAMLVVIAIFPGHALYGTDRLLSFFRKRAKSAAGAEAGEDKAYPNEVPEPSVKRREMIKDLATLPFAGAFAFSFYKKAQWKSMEEKYLLESDTDAISSATLKTFNFSRLDDLKGNLPKGRIKDLELSRLFLGGNLIGGWAHARDLIYVSKLIKAYHTDERVINTFQLAEACSINAILTNPRLIRIINKYWREAKGNIRFISDCGYGDNVFKGIDMSVEGGAHAIYIQGGISDGMVREGKVETLARAFEYAARQGVPAGIGAHDIRTIKAAVDNGIRPDFWVKTIHHHDYWSAKNEETNDNIFCPDPRGTIDFMAQLEEPWIAFKILAAGAIHPREGFRYALDNGADFLCVGMYDFQLVDDVNIALDVLGNVNRKRPWRA